MRRDNGITLIALIITIIILVILAAVSIRAVTNMGIVGHAINGTQQYAEKAKEENEMLDETVTKLESAVAKVKEIQNGSETSVPDVTKNKWKASDDSIVPLARAIFKFNSNGTFTTANTPEFVLKEKMYSINENTLIIKGAAPFDITLTWDGEKFVGDLGEIKEGATMTLAKYNPPKFTIAGTEYEYDEGMTWEAWVASDYNIDGFQVSSGADKTIYRDFSACVYNNESYVIKSDPIDGTVLYKFGEFPNF